MRTSLYADGTVDPGTKTINGDLIVDGDGDPMFYENNAQILAQSLARDGISHVTGDLIIKGAFSINRNASPQASAERMTAALRGAGVKIAGQTRFGEGRGGTTELVVHESGTPLIQVLLYQNAHSDNAIAERIGDAIGGPQALTEFLVKNVGIPKDEVFISRTSGLDYNRITPNAMMRVLNRLMDVLDAQQLKPEDLLPVAGVDAGTLRTRFRGDEWHGAVIGKTGSLPGTDGGVSTLAGIAYTQKYGPVLYAIFNTGGSVHQYRKWQDDFLEELIYECGGPVANARLENALDQEIRLDPTVHIYSVTKSVTKTELSQ
jgi:D-alanyl-D-alanine carboxypeptidase/D-alanyl-D-alanine-endopeptidase (penicillin-binding protein 4)